MKIIILKYILKEILNKYSLNFFIYGAGQQNIIIVLTGSPCVPRIPIGPWLPGTPVNPLK